VRAHPVLVGMGWQDAEVSVDERADLVARLPPHWVIGYLARRESRPARSVPGSRRNSPRTAWLRGAGQAPAQGHHQRSVRHIREWNERRARDRAVRYGPRACLIDPWRAIRAQLARDGRNVLVLGCESADHPVDAELARVVEIAKDHQGICATPSIEDSEAAVSAWRSAFLRMP
jgi:hypothetical protein